MRPQQLALPSRQTFLHHSCRRITPQSRFRVAHLSTTVVLEPFQSGCGSGVRAFRPAIRTPAQFLALAAEVVRPQRLKRFFLSPLEAGLKVRTTRASGYTNPRTALTTSFYSHSKINCK